MQFLRDHLIKYLILILSGLIIALYYLIRNQLVKNNSKRITRKISSNSEYAKELCFSLEMLYRKESLKKQIIEGVNSLNKVTVFEDHTIVLLNRVDFDNYLIVTKNRDLAVNFTLPGSMGEIISIRLFFYRLNIDRLNNQLKIFSDYYTDQLDKAIRESFARRLFKYLLD